MRASLLFAYDVAAETSEQVVVTAGEGFVTLVVGERGLTFDREDLLEALALDESRERAA